ncbi:MAG TPA: TIGR00730 family Rossman fold protein [Verrucomicrobiae bacterium]|nr:TIGR00730 family Rossman fold protein [Verrucomicrobiae bacterium]
MNASPAPFRRLCVFCGSSKGARDTYVQAAQALGRELGRCGIELVYGGGNVGLMGVVADAVLAADGRVIGVIPEALMARELGHRTIQDLRVVKTMHERKAMMADLADGFIALPGGIGTYEEFFEVLTWTQLGLHTKPCALLNVDGFYDPVLRLLDHAVEERFVRAAHRELIVVETDPAALLQRMAGHRAPRLHKWIDKDAL